MAEVRQFRQDTQIIHGTTAQNNAKLTDIIPLQHEDLATQTNQMKKISLGQCLCEPFAVCNSNNPANGAYVADCVNFPDFTLQFTDGQGNNHSLIGLKVRVLFNYGITYGSVSGGTYPTLNINGSGAIPLLAQGKTMGAGAISAGQTVEFTIIPYGNSLAFDADSNVREANSDYTVYTDGSITYSANKINLFGRTIEQTTGGDTRVVLIGKTESADYSQGYTEIEFIGGRVDGYLGFGYLFLAQNSLVIGKSMCIMSNLSFQVTQKDNQMYVYCTMDTYSNLIANISIRSKFTILNQIVSSVEGTQIWANNWIDV